MGDPTQIPEGAKVKIDYTEVPVEGANQKELTGTVVSDPYDRRPTPDHNMDVDVHREDMYVRVLTYNGILLRLDRISGKCDVCLGEDVEVTVIE